MCLTKIKKNYKITFKCLEIKIISPNFSLKPSRFALLLLFKQKKILNDIKQNKMMLSFFF